LSKQVVAALNGEPGGHAIAFVAAGSHGEDLTIALHTLYELHYGGFDGVDLAREWDPELLRLRGPNRRRLPARLGPM
jgi:hypothetical protein